MVLICPIRPIGPMKPYGHATVWLACLRDSRGLQRPGVNAALSAALAGADPSPGALVGVGDDMRAGPATQAAIALRVQRVDGHPVQRQVLPHLALVPEQDRVELQQAFVAL